MNLPETFTITLTDEHLRKAIEAVGASLRISSCLVAQAAKDVFGDRVAVHVENISVRDGDLVFLYESDNHVNWVHWFDVRANTGESPSVLPMDRSRTLEYRRRR